MSQFKEINSHDDVKEVIKAAFDTDFEVSGAWGYSEALATIIHETNIPLIQFEHMFASMRAYIEMNMTLSEEARYGSINLNEISREELLIDGIFYDKVMYELTAMKESVYNAFINEYKAGYGKENFDISEHFNQRKKETLTRHVTHWFQVQQKD